MAEEINADGGTAVAYACNVLDKASMEEVHDLLQRFKAQDKTVLLASHSTEDIARACDVIYEMEDGELHLVKQ